MNPQGPPISPDVMAQQMPPMSAYGPQADQLLGNKPQDATGAHPDDFIKSQMDDIAAKLMTVAKVIGQTHKELMPIVQKMAEAGSMLMNEINSQNQPVQGQEAPQGQAQASGPSGMALGA